MATKSILKEVRFKDRNLCRGFVSALEHAEGKKSKNVVMSRTISDVKKDDVKNFFGVSK